jgi:hypothetical protein
VRQSKIVFLIKLVPLYFRLLGVKVDNLSKERRGLNKPAWPTKHFVSKGSKVAGYADETFGNFLKGSDDGVLHLKGSCFWTFSIVVCFVWV